KILEGQATSQFETVFLRADGVRVPVLVFEAPLVDSNGRHTGWMGSVLDITDRKRAEELSRRQQEKLETSARLATMGEISPLQARQSYVTLQVECPPDLPPVLADRVLLEQVLLNLTRNAIEAMQAIEPARRMLRITAARIDDRVAVSVIDNGHGIAPEVAERL